MRAGVEGSRRALRDHCPAQTGPSPPAPPPSSGTSLSCGRGLPLSGLLGLTTPHPEHGDPSSSLPAPEAPLFSTEMPTNAQGRCRRLGHPGWHTGWAHRTRRQQATQRPSLNTFIANPRGGRRACPRASPGSTARLLRPRLQREQAGAAAAGSQDGGATGERTPPPAAVPGLLPTLTAHGTDTARNTEAGPGGQPPSGSPAPGHRDAGAHLASGETGPEEQSQQVQDQPVARGQGPGHPAPCASAHSFAGTREAALQQKRGEEPALPTHRRGSLWRAVCQAPRPGLLWEARPGDGHGAAGRAQAWVRGGGSRAVGGVAERDRQPLSSDRNQVPQGRCRVWAGAAVRGQRTPVWAATGLSPTSRASPRTGCRVPV